MKKMLLVSLCAMMAAGCDGFWKTAHLIAQHTLDIASGVAGINNIFSLGLFPY